MFLQATISRRGPAARLLKLFDDRQYILVASEALVDEIRDVLTRPIIRRTNPHYTNEDIERVLSRLHNNTLFVKDIPEHFQYARDPNDEHVINLAIESGATYLIARDKDLLDLANEKRPDAIAFRARYPGLRILDPVAFLNERTGPGSESAMEDNEGT